MKEHITEEETIFRFNSLESRIPCLLRVLITIIVMSILTYIVYRLNIPNPNMIIVSGLVVFASVFGISGGIPAALIMLLYTLFFFSDKHDFVSFDTVNLHKVEVSAIGIVIITVFVCLLKHYENIAFSRMQYLTEMLKKDNELLDEAARTDVLTNIRNRMALKRDYLAYLDNDLHIMMLDFDDFKNANDSYGHETGDYILKEAGRILGDIYGQNNTYRYGGDEFIVICKDIPENDFAHKCEILKQQITAVRISDPDYRVGISAGYVYGRPKTEEELNDMVARADQNLYAAKGSGKNMICGCAYK